MAGDVEACSPHDKQRPIGKLIIKLIWITLLVAALLLMAIVWIYRSESILLLEDIAAGEGPSRLKQKVEAPSRVTIRYRALGRDYQADFYQPSRVARAAILLVPGAAEQGKDDPRLVAFANSMARVGFTVLVPNLPEVQQLHLGPENIRELVAGFQHLESLHPAGMKHPMGMAAFSYAAGPAVLAALDQEIGKRVDFVIAVGGYYSIEHVLRFMTTGRYDADGRQEYLEPRPYGRLVFVSSQMDFLSRGDRQVFERMIERQKQDPDAALDSFAAELDEGGRAIFRFLENRDPDRVQELIQALPQVVRANLTALDPSRHDLSRLHARLILIHGRYDDMIPYTESLVLSAAAPQAEAFIVRGLEHVDIPPGMGDRYTMWRAVRAILGLRDSRATHTRP